MEMPGHARTGHPAEVETEIESLRLDRLFKRSAPVHETPLEIEEMVVCKGRERRAVVEWGHEEMAIRVREPVDHDQARPSSGDDPEAAVVFAAGSGCPTEKAVDV